MSKKTKKISGKVSEKKVKKIKPYAETIKPVKKTKPVEELDITTIDDVVDSVKGVFVSKKPVIVEEEEEYVPQVKVFPSDIESIKIFEKEDGSDKGHHYSLLKTTGWDSGTYNYINEPVLLNFIKKNKKGLFPGIQSEQLILVVLDRTIKLNKTAPCEENEIMIQACKDFLEAAAQRVMNKIIYEEEAQLLRDLENSQLDDNITEDEIED